MIIMEQGATEKQIDKVVNEIKKYGLRAEVSRGAFRTVIGLVGDETKADFERLGTLPGVKETRMVETPYKLISREFNKASAGDTPAVVKVGKVEFGGKKPVYIAGPCAIESKAQLFKIAEGVKKAGAHVLRGGVFKPRSSAHTWQGLGGEGGDLAEDALSWLREAGDKLDMPVVTEVRGEGQVDLIAEYVDIIQIGARNMYNQDLLVKAARKNKPIIYKRHFGASVEEFLSFAEYIAAEGNKNIILCERGLVPVGKGKSYTRYVLDLGSIPAIQKETYLPIMVDPSHAAGRRDLIYSMSVASIASGACGLMIESHYNPSEALVDGKQMVTPDELKDIIDACERVYKAIQPRSKAKK